MTITYEDGSHEDREHFANGEEREARLAPQVISRRKLLTSIGLAGAVRVCRL